MQQIVYKVPGGKLLKIDVHLSGHIIEDIEIRGDFFVHPEDAIDKLNEFLTGSSLDENFVDTLTEFIMTEGIDIFGFSAQDIYDALTQTNEN